MPVRLLLAVILLAGVGVSNAHAAPSTKRCQAAIGAAGRQLFAASLESLAECRARIATGASPVGTDCRADTQVVTARNRAAAAAGKRLRPCNDARVAALALAGDCTGVVTVAGLRACLRASHEAEAELLLGVTGADAALPAAGQGCASGAADATRDYATASLRILQSCKQKPGKIAPGDECRWDGPPAKRLGRDVLRATQAVSGACGGAGAVGAARFAPPCDRAADAAALGECLLAAANVVVERVVLAEHPNPGFCGDAGAAVDRRVDKLVRRMSLEEKVAQMHGLGLSAPLWRTTAVERLKVPGFRMLDGPRGVSAFAPGHATAFPVGMARGATWDPALEERVGEAMGAEIRAKGANVILAPTINLLNHPRWGRAQETYGEDPFHLGRMGVGFIRGAQRHVVTSAKHFAANNIEDTRLSVSVELDERTLREVYLPHFQAAVQEGHTGSVMSAYNRVRGAYCGENAHLLREVLKGEWGFRGFVESDWTFGTRSTVAAAKAGLDIEMPSPIYYGPKLMQAVEKKEVPRALVDESVRRIVRTQLCFRLDSDPPVEDPSMLESPAHLALALEVARKSIVLLKNDATTLPLARAANPSIVVVGDLAATANIGDTGSSNVSPSSIVTALDGIRSVASPAVTVTHVAGPPLAPADEAAVMAANAVIVVVGLTSMDEGEGAVSAGDREGLGLAPEEDALIAAVAAKNPKTIVVLEGGSAITMPWIASIPAVLMAWYPGQAGGTAIGEILFGDVNPSGRLPLSFPVTEADLPPFDNTSQSVTYGFLHGYRWLDAHGTAPLFPLGHGLSYTTFRYSNLRVASSARAAGGRVRVLADVSNDGAVAGDEVAQLYVSAPGSRVERAPRELKAFARVALAPGETKTVILDVRASDLAFWDTAANAWVVEPLTYGVHVGSSARELPLSGSFTLVQ